MIDGVVTSHEHRAVVLAATVVCRCKDALEGPVVTVLDVFKSASGPAPAPACLDAVSIVWPVVRSGAWSTFSPSCRSPFVDNLNAAPRHPRHWMATWRR